MMDVSKIGQRQQQARRVTNNRDGVLPARRNTSAPDVQVRADMRTAIRGDKSRDLQKALGLLEDGVGAIGQIKHNGEIERAPAEAAKGDMDAIGGFDADPALAKSTAYQRAFYGVRAEKKFNEFATGLQTEADRLIDSGADPDEIQEALMGRIVGFRDDVVETIPTPEAQLATAQRLSAMGAKLQVEIASKIKERTDEALQADATGNVQTRLRSGQPVSFEADVGILVQAGVPLKDAKKLVMAAVTAVALDRENPNPQLLNELLASTQANGKTPSLSAEEQLQVQNLLTQADSLVRQNEQRAKEDGQQAYETRWFAQALAGENFDTEIAEAQILGVFSAREAAAWRNTARGIREDVDEGDDNEDLVLNLKLALADPKANPRKIREQIVDAYNEGQLGTGLAAKRAYVGLMGNVYSQIEAAAAEAKADARAAGADSRSLANARESDGLTYLNAMIRPKDGGFGRAAQTEWQVYLGAVDEYRRRITGGEPPRAVADDLIARSKPATQPKQQSQVREFGQDGKLR